MKHDPNDPDACLRGRCPEWRARRKVQSYGDEALLDLEEAAAVIDVSPSQFERLGVPCVPWSARGRRWRYGAITARARHLEESP